MPANCQLMNRACPSPATQKKPRWVPNLGMVGGAPILIRKESKGNRILLIVYHFQRASHEGATASAEPFIPRHRRVICMLGSTPAPSGAPTLMELD